MSVTADLRAVQARLADIASAFAPASAPAPRPPSASVDATAFASAVADVRPDPSALAQIVADGARSAGLDPALVRAVVETESGFDPSARSGAGAGGLMQLMPATAHAYGVANVDDPVQNVRGGTAYLRSLVDRFGDLRLALAAYNAGPGAVSAYGGVPPFAETRAYVAHVLELARATH